MYSARLRRFVIRLACASMLLFGFQQVTFGDSVDVVQTTKGLEIDTIAERRVVVATNEGPLVQLVPAGQLNVDDEVFYTVTVRNTTSVSIANATVVKAIPRNTRYIVDSAVGPATTVTLSIDGGVTFGSANELAIPSSATAMRPAIADDFTHIRWQLGHPLAPGATAILRFRCSFK